MICILVATISMASAAERPDILFCIADDWSWPHASAYGDKVVQTPVFDRIAREGALFNNAFCASPSCTPSRAAILTGRYPHQLREGGNLWGFLPKEFTVFPDVLEAAGYAIGLQGKGWGPGDLKAGGRSRNPSGPTFKSFEQFLQTVPDGKPFYFWFGSTDAHRPYQAGSGSKGGLKAGAATLPPYFPDAKEVREDVLDYYYEVQRFDREVGNLLELLEKKGRLENTIVVMTSDNGMPFPRCKANLYDSGCRMPLVIRWPKGFRGGRAIDTLVSHVDLAPTLLEACGTSSSENMAGKSLLSILRGNPEERRVVFFERERHANVRRGDVGYPVRALRTTNFLYVRNFYPDRWPVGDPQMWKAVGEFGDCDNSPTKSFILNNRSRPNARLPYALAFAKRPREELYDLSKDPYQVQNVATNSAYADPLQKLRSQMDDWMRQTSDPRVAGGGDEFDSYPYFGQAPIKNNRDVAVTRP